MCYFKMKLTKIEDRKSDGRCIYGSSTTENSEATLDVFDEIIAGGCNISLSCSS
jgi:hypothetical protein